MISLTTKRVPTVILNDDVLIEVLKFSNRFDINERFEFVNVHWSRCISLTEAAHLPRYKMYKIWFCPLFCALHYNMTPTRDIILRGLFPACSQICREKFMQFVTDDWPAQRIPFCVYIQKSLSEPETLQKITFNYDNWRIERPENAHFFLHFRDVCFEQAFLDIYNDQSLTTFLLDCPIFQLCTGHFATRTTTDPFPFQRFVEFAEQKVLLLEQNKSNAIAEKEDPKLLEQLIEEAENPIFKFVLTGKCHCSELTLEAHQFQTLFDLIDEYKDAHSLCHAVPVVNLTVPPYGWHQRPFIEGTLCNLFHTSERLTPLLHQFAYFDESSTLKKFACNVHFSEGDEDNVEFYEFRVQMDD